ncbi:MAG: acetyl-CoA carboxylase biotin carboxylase subunit [Desulfobacteraceae bacterium]|nr:acetyl-CoA carboxylase biotin carboxylase subunit [Desulfobacteraceae bacterium]
MLTKVLIANRGEIALRILRACREMGIATVAVYSDADARTPAVALADEAVHIGPPLSRKSYLNTERILEAAKETAVDAVHPGYGFLSENAAFARACEKAGLTFIGPSPEAIAMAGDKSTARKTLAELGVPVIPGSKGVVSSAEEAVAAAEAVGYPVIVKASGGGGGRGMRIARNAAELASVFSVASAEAGAAFGNAAVYLEKYIQRPRHIEIQILADAHGHVIHLGERECSIQQRYQKLIEESPSPLVDADLRDRMGRTAVRVARAIGYVNAGTMEFLVDADRNYYFMEVNARVQVEHPVTEMVTGVDIVAEQIRIASGQALSIRQEDVRLTGWSLECRINAADPDQDFMPSPGEVDTLILPGGPWVRVDTALVPGCFVPPFYDSLVAKLVVWAPDRPAAIRRMARALSEFRIDGIAVTIPFHQRVVEDPEFRRGDYDTHFLKRFLQSGS